MGGRLWRHADFLKLWAGETVSILGSSITTLALPTLAIFRFHAGPAQVGLLIALNRLAFPVLAIPAGAWLDRRRKRPVMIAADLGRLLVLGSIPAGLALGQLSLLWLYAAALLAGILTVFFDLAYLSFMPALVERRDLVEANTKLEFSYAVSNIAGPGLGGLLIQFAGAARAVLADAASFGVSAAALLMIRKAEVTPEPSGRRMHREIGEGLRFVLGTPLLLTLLICQGISIVGAHAVEAVEYPFAYVRLQLTPGALGGVIAFAGVGAIVGATINSSVTRRLGVGPAIALSGGVLGLCLMALPLALFGPALPILTILFFVLGVADPINNVGQLSMRQSATPDRLQARMNSIFRTVYWGFWPLGNLIGGWLGASAGLVPTIVGGGAFTAVGLLLMLLTPAGRVREHTLLENA